MSLDKSNYNIIKKSYLNFLKKRELKGKSIKIMFNSKARTSIILDEIDSIDNKKEYNANDITNFLYYETNKFYSKQKKKVIKKEKKYIINKNPIICTCNSIDKTLKGLLNEVLINTPIPVRFLNSVSNCLNLLLDCWFTTCNLAE